MIKVVVVDDSAFMRKAISTMLSKDPDIDVVATARDGEEGLELIRKHNPDVVTLDIEMPRMDGLTALRHIMMEMPRPVLMISSLTNEGAEATLKALELGAVDFIPKQLSKVSLDIVKIEASLIAKVKIVASRKLMHSRPRPAPAPRPAQNAPSTAAGSAPRPAYGAAASASGGSSGGPVITQNGSAKRDVVVIGVSTGGPPAVQKVLSAFPANFPASIVIAQHMPQAFTGPFAKRLDGLCQISVKEAEPGDRLKPGQAFIAPGGKHLLLKQLVSRVDLEISAEPASALYKPSANVLIASAAEAVGRRALGVILTGMGNDGMEGIRALKQKGGRALAQSDASCVVYGMPKAIVDAGLSDEVVDIDDMAQAIMNNLYM